MELRYLGFDALMNARGYRFDLMVRGEPAKHFVVKVDLALFRTHGVGIQEGPGLCAHKLAADLETCSGGIHELTAEDLRAYADARASAEAQKAEARSASRRPKPPLSSQSPWRRPPQ